MTTLTETRREPDEFVMTEEMENALAAHVTEQEQIAQQDIDAWYQQREDEQR